MIRKLVILVILLLIGGCAHLPAGKGESPEALLADACRPGQANREVTGSVWMSLESREEHGRFPASVSAQAPGKVTIEVTNLIGSREALIRVDNGSYTIDVPNNQGGTIRRGHGSGSWGGIPLHWAAELFLGRVPCPSPATPAGLRLRVTPDGELIAETPAGPKAGSQRFVYRFRQWAGRAWPESLHWERKGKTWVDFKFDDPEDKTGSPRKWEAKSARGEVKLRWTGMEISPEP